MDEKTRLLVLMQELQVDDIKKTDSHFLIFFSTGCFKTTTVKIPRSEDKSTLGYLLDNYNGGCPISRLYSNNYMLLRCMLRNN